MKNIITYLLALTTLVACVEEFPQSALVNGKNISIPITLCVEDDIVTKSSVGAESQLDAFESRISDFTVFVFESVGGKWLLYKSYYYDRSSQSANIQGVIGSTYRLYALVNCGDKRNAVSVGSAEGRLQMLNITSSIADLSLTTGMPMACGPVDVTLSNNGSIRLYMTRLMARFDLKLVQDFSRGSFTLKSLKLRQSPTLTSPFASTPNAFKSSQASSLSDGDYASEVNVTALMSGSQVRFYTLENACGVLLNNSSQNSRLKVPSSGTSIGGYLPTYIEATGTYTDKTGGLICENTYRMFLGENAYDNFNVKRGTRYTLTLTLTDEDGFIDSYWKLDPIVSDSRQFRFASRSYSISPASSTSVRVLNNLADYGIYYQLTGNLTGVSFNSSSLTLSQGRYNNARTGTLSAYYWDGRLADQCSITALAHIVDVKPIGIEQVETYWESTYWTSMHDPNCTIPHGNHHDDCPNNIFHMYPNHPGYMDPYYCPYNYPEINDCPNRVVVPSGAGITGVNFVIATNYRVDSNGNLIYDILQPGVDYELIEAKLLTLAGQEGSDGINYLEPSYNGNTMNIEAQFQDGNRTHWHIRIQCISPDLDQEIRTYIVSTAGNKQQNYPESKITFPSHCDYRFTYNFRCSPTTERIWFVTDDSILEFENSDEPDKYNSFNDNEEIFASVYQKGKVTPVYAMNMKGVILGRVQFSTDDVSPHIIQCELQNYDMDAAPILKYGFYSGFAGCYLPISCDDWDMYLLGNYGSIQYDINVVENYHFSVTSDGYILTADYQGQEHFDYWEMDMSSIMIGGRRYRFLVRDDETWSLTAQ